MCFHPPVFFHFLLWQRQKSANFNLQSTESNIRLHATSLEMLNSHLKRRNLITKRNDVFFFSVKTRRVRFCFLFLLNVLLLGAAHPKRCVVRIVTMRKRENLCWCDVWWTEPDEEEEGEEKSTKQQIINEKKRKEKKKETHRKDLDENKRMLNEHKKQKRKTRVKCEE